MSGADSTTEVTPTGRLANAAEVGNLGVFAYPDAVINNAAQMLHEMAVDFGRDLADRFVKQNFNSGVGGPSRASRIAPGAEGPLLCLWRPKQRFLPMPLPRNHVVGLSSFMTSSTGRGCW